MKGNFAVPYLVISLCFFLYQGGMPLSGSAQNSTQNKLKTETDVTLESTQIDSDTESVLPSLADSLESQVNHAGTPSEKMKAYLRLGDYYAKEDVNNYIAIRHYGTALENASTARDRATILYKTGNCYETLGEYELAAGQFIGALEEYTSLNDTSGMAATMLSIGSLHSELEEFASGQIQLEKAEKLAQEASLDSILVEILNTRGVLYRKAKEYDRAWECYEQSLEVILASGNRLAEIDHYLNSGALSWYMEKDTSRSLYLTRKGLALSREEGSRRKECVALGNLSHLLFKSGRIADAIKVCRQSLQLAIELEEKEYQKRHYLELSRMEESRNRPSEALKYFKQFSQLNDTLAQQTSKQKVAEITEKYRNEELRKEVNNLSQEALLDEIAFEAERKNAATTRNLLIAGMIILLLIGLGVVVFLWQKHLTAQAIARKDMEIARMQALDKGQEQERRRLAAELHDGIGSMLTGIRMKLSGMPDPKGDLRPIISQMTRACEEVRKASYDLAHIGRSEDFPGKVRKQAEDLFGNSETNATVEFINVESLKHLTPSVNLHLWRISQELLHNVARHAGARNVIYSMTIHDDRLDLLVEDDGNGKLGAGGTGLQNIKDRISRLGGKIHFDGRENRGTSVHLILHLSEDHYTVNPIMMFPDFTTFSGQESNPDNPKVQDPSHQRSNPNHHITHEN